MFVLKKKVRNGYIIYDTNYMTILEKAKLYEVVVRQVFYEVKRSVVVSLSGGEKED